MITIITILFAFLCGSIPTGYILAKKFHGIDIRNEGSGNIGSTNMNRILGRKMSVATQTFDILKGLIPVGIAICLGKNNMISMNLDLYYSIVALAAILGHNYTPFLKFNGGKGVNTTLGAFFLLTPIATLSGVLAYFVLKFATKIVSIRSLSLGVTIFIVSILLKVNSTVVIAVLIANILLIIRHKENIKRIIHGEE